MVTNTRGNSRSTKASRSKTTSNQPKKVPTNKKTNPARKKTPKPATNDEDQDSDFQDDPDLHDDDDMNGSDSDSASVNKTTTSDNLNQVNPTKKKGRRKQAPQPTSTDSRTPITNNQEDSSANNNNQSTDTTTVFRSRFPGLELDNFEDSLDEWTVVALRQNIAKQGSTLSRAAPEIDALVKTIRLQYEKRMLMAALMGGLPEAVVWSIVGEGGRKGYSNCWIRFLGFCKRALEEKLPARADKDEWVNRNKKLSRIWKKLSQDEKMVFRDPYFFSLAKLPDLSYIEPEDDAPVEEDFSMQHLEAETSSPTIHRLSEADRLKYQPLFDKLVDVEKLHTCHGKPEPTASVATLQKKSLTELQKAHHDFSVVCQRYQITYYLAAVSCGSFEGWSKVFSNNVSFARWAEKDAKVPSKFRTYIHGKTVEKEIEGCKVQQPSDERRTRLTRQLNQLVDDVYKGNIFPKVADPVGEMKARGWPIRIVQKEGSLLSEEALMTGHRSAKDAIIKLWLQDIENKNFLIETIPEAQQTVKPKQTKRKKKPTKPISPSTSEEEDEPTHTQGPLAQQDVRRANRQDQQNLTDSENEQRSTPSGSRNLNNVKDISGSHLSDEDIQPPRRQKKRIREESHHSSEAEPDFQPSTKNIKHSQPQSHPLENKKASGKGPETNEDVDESLDGLPLEDD